MGGQVKLGRYCLVATAAAAVALAGCSSSGKSSGNSGSTAPPATTPATATGPAGRGVTATSIKIDVIASLTSPQGPVFPGFDTGVKARYEAINKAGGINGRMLVLGHVYDDATNATQDLNDVKEAIQQDKAFALIVGANGFTQQGADFAAANQTPVIGWGFSTPFCNQKWTFGFTGCLVSTTQANGSLTAPLILNAGVPPAQVKVALQAANDDVGKGGNAQDKFLIAKQGAKVVYDQANIPDATAVTDYSPYATAIKASGANVVIINTNFGDVIGLTSALKQAGFEGKIMNYATYVPGLLGSSQSVASALSGAYVMTQEPPQESETAAIKQIEADLTAIGQKPFITLGATVGYWTADVLIAMIQKTGANLTGSALEAAVNGGFSYAPAAAGGIGTVAFPQDHSQAVPCSSLLEVVGTQYKVVSPFTCYENYPFSS